MRRVSRLRDSQSGMALIVSLVILLSMTLLGLAAIQNSTLEERMAGNTRAANIALQSAETALRTAEELIAKWPAQPKPKRYPGTNPDGDVVWILESPDPQWNETTWPANDNQYAWWEETGPKWWQDRAVVAPEQLVYATLTDKQDGEDVTTSLAMAADRVGRFIIEERGLSKETLVVGQQQDLSGPIYYQVTARGLDDAGRGEVFLRSITARRF